MIVKAQGLLYNNCEEGDCLESENNIVQQNLHIFYLIDKFKLYCPGSHTALCIIISLFL